MRGIHGPVAFGALVLAAVLAACGGGGGGSHLLPSQTSPGTGGGSNGSSSTVQRAMVLEIPPPSQQNARSRPFYISSGTHSFGVLAVAATSTESPNPSDLTIFPVATPSPCAAASNGGLTCTLTVQAPIGTDTFYMAAFSQVSPGPNAVPLSEYAAQDVVVSASPGPNATPLTFSLNGVVYTVAVRVSNPDTAISNTELFPAGTAATPVPLIVDALDSSGAQIAMQTGTTFIPAITIAASPANAGVGVALTSSSCTATGSSHQRRDITLTSSVTINCASDLGNVVVGYDGTTLADSSDHITDTVAIEASPLPSTQPSPPTIGLSSNQLEFEVLPGQNLSTGLLVPNPAGGLVFVVSSDGVNTMGTFDTSTYASNTATLNNVYGPVYLAMAPNGTVLLADNGSIDCFTSVASAMGGTPAQVTTVSVQSDEDPLEVVALTVDSTNTVWYDGYDNGDDDYYGDGYAGSFSVASGCPASTLAAPLQPSGEFYDYDPYMVPLPGGGAALASSNGTTSAGVYEFTTASSGTVPEIDSALSGSDGTGGIAADPAGDIYASFESGTSDIESIAPGGDVLSSLLTLPPTSGDLPAAYPSYLDGFAPTSTIDRMEYVDYDFNALALVEGVPASPTPVLVTFPNAYNMYQTSYSTKGAEYVMYTTYTGTEYDVYIGRALPTTYWSVPSTMTLGNACNPSGLYGILQRGGTGSFNLDVSNDSVTTQAMPGATHDYYLTVSAGGTFTATVTNTADGRSESTLITAPYTGLECGAAHRHVPPRIRKPFAKPKGR